jgi:L-rhamnose isomerase
MKEANILKSYELAKERYAAIGVDTDKAIAELEKQQISLHCWQTDDVSGFENDGSLTGGIQATGNYPGRARNIDEVRKDLEFVKTLLAGNHRVNLHEIYGDFGGKFVDRDQVGVEHFQSWIDWAKANGFKLDFNSTSFSHPKSGDLSLSNPDKAIRDFWIEHTIRCRKIADAMGKAQNDPCIMNIWVHDGQKDYTVNRKKYREILAASLDEILKEDMPGMKSCVEAKLFGIGLESYTVGSHDFYTAYCATRKQMYTLDTGHYEPTENVSDFVSTLLMYVPELMLHVSRPVRWDSDHVTIMNDQTLDLFKELVRSNGLDRAHVGLDYFDASINRIGAYIIGSRATQKCILQAMLEPLELLRQYEDNGQYFERLALMEEAKSMPFGAVFDYFNLQNNVPVGEEFISCIQEYERNVTSKRS